MKQSVISLFDFSGVMVDPWVAAGYEGWIIDIRHPNGPHQDGGLVRVGDDLRERVLFFPSKPSMVFAFPPCDHLAVSGARWFRGKGLRALARSIDTFATAAEFAENMGCPYMIENPVSTISTYWRKPDHIFHPWEYAGFDPGDGYTKKTCLWTGGGFIMPEPFLDANAGTPDSRIHFAPPGNGRKAFRSRTPAGFARAVFEANHKKTGTAA